MIELLLCLLFFLSGVAALMFENLWFYQAGLVLGNSVWASSLVLAGFMGGLALGNALAANWGSRVPRPIRAYAALELVIGLTGVAIVCGLPYLTPVLAALLAPLGDLPAATNALRFSTALLILLVPATAMGATLPILVRALYRRDARFGPVLGRLYGWNTLGAVAGALVGDLLLIGPLGIRGTGFVALALNVVAAAGALRVARRLETTALPPPVARAAGPIGAEGRIALGAAALAGFLFLALEVVWFRFLTLFVVGTSAAFAILLAVILSGIALGGLLAGRIASRLPHSERSLPALAFAAGAIAVVLYAVFQGRPVVTSRLDMARLAATLMLPVAVLSGVLFTMLGQVLHEHAREETRAAGLLTLFNTGGSTLGSLAAGLILLPALGVEHSIWLLAGGYVVLGVLLARVTPLPTRITGRIVATAVALAGVLAVAFFPRGVMQARHLAVPISMFSSLDGSRPVAVREGLSETLIYMRRDLFGEPLDYRMVTNGLSMTGTTLHAKRYMKLFVYLPVALSDRIESALLISYGVGMTAKALVDTRSLRSIDVVDISPDVLEMGRRVHPRNAYPLDDPRVRTHVEDGRHYLETTSRQFDLITGEPPPPEAAGIVSLYTREYFALMRDRLSPRGIATYWLPAHSLLESDARTILRAFCDVFEDCTLWTGAGLDWIMVGTRGGLPTPVDARVFAAQWSDPVVGPSLRRIGVERPEQLGALFLAGADDLAALLAHDPPLTDDRPKRLSDDISDVTTALATFRPWMDVAIAKRRFAASPWIAKHWPPSIRAETLRMFGLQELVDAALVPGSATSGTRLALVHRVAAEWGLTTLPLWYLGSDDDRQRAARAAEEHGRKGARIAVELGVGALAEQRYSDALEHFRAAHARGAGAVVQSLAIYARCMSEGPGARSETGATLDGDPGAPRFRPLLERICREGSGAAG